MIRPINPTDLPILLSLKNKLSSNEAYVKDSLGTFESTPSSSMSIFLKQWVSPPLKHKQRCWVWVDGMGIRGLVSIRSRYGSSAWEINHLLLTRDSREDICCDLLGMLGNCGMELGAKKVFLRLSTSSPLVDAARHAGFLTYLCEHLYQMKSGTSIKKSRQKSHPRYTIHPWERSDEYRLFQLYNATFPPPVRAIEGMTFKEWQEARGKLACQQWKKQFVCESEGNLAAQFQLTTEENAGQFEVVVRPGEDLGEILRYILIYLQDYHPIRCLVPEFDGALAEILRRYSFEPMTSYSVLARPLTIQVKDPSLMPINV